MDPGHLLERSRYRLVCSPTLRLGSRLSPSWVSFAILRRGSIKWRLSIQQPNGDDSVVKPSNSDGCDSFIDGLTQAKG